jgi:hypothetical protein
MQNTRNTQTSYRGGRPQYRAQRWAPPPEPKPEPKLDLSDKSFPTLPSSSQPSQSTGQHEFPSTFTTTIKVMAEMEKSRELRAQRERDATQQQKDALKGVYTARFQPGRLTSRREEPEEDAWRPPQELREPTEEDEWTEVRHSKARKIQREKTAEELDQDYREKATDEDAVDGYNEDLFERSHQHDHYAT